MEEATTKTKKRKEYKVEDLAKYLKIKPPTARLNLRKARIKKTGRAYAWKSESEMKAVAKRLSAA